MRQVTPLPHDWDSYLDDWLLAKGRSLSPRTQLSFRDSFIYLARFLGPVAPPLADLTKKQVAAWIDFTIKTTSPATAALRFRGLAAVINWLAHPGEDDEPYLPKNPIKGLRPPKVEEQPVPVLSIEDLRALIRACKKAGSDFEARRDEAIIRVLIDTGIRRGEVVSMTVTGTELMHGRALVTGKTGPRWVALGPSTVAAVHRYLRLRRSRGHGDALWLGHKGPLSGNGLFQILSRRFEQASVTASRRVHVFRHSFAHAWKAQGGGDAELVALAGWKGPAMAYRYGASAAMERAHDAHKRLSPGEMIDSKAKRF